MDDLANKSSAPSSGQTMRNNLENIQDNSSDNNQDNNHEIITASNRSKARMIAVILTILFVLLGALTSYLVTHNMASDIINQLTSSTPDNLEVDGTNFSPAAKMGDVIVGATISATMAPVIMLLCFFIISGIPITITWIVYKKKNRSNSNQTQPDYQNLKS